VNQRKRDALPSQPIWTRLRLADRRVLLALGDLVAVNLSVLVALRIWALVGERAFGPPFLISQAFWFPLLSILWLTLAAANNYYDLALASRTDRSLMRLIPITLQLVVMYLFIFFLSPRDALPRLFVLYHAALSTVLIAAWRVMRITWLDWLPVRRRVLVVGTGWEAQAILDAIKQYAASDYTVVGIVDEGRPLHHEEIVVNAEAIGYAPDLARISQALAADEIVLATGGDVGGELFQGVMDCYELGIPVTSMPILYEQLTGMVPVEHVRGHWNVVLPLAASSVFDPYPLIKRMIDILLSLFGLMLFGVLLPPIGLVMTLDCPGPLFFSQERVGRAGRVFRMIKLRTMVPDAENYTGPIMAAQDDPRVTRVGAFLRRSRLDEVPQLVNVLRGEMSLVGPRPERPYFVEQLQARIPFYRTRLAIRPGVTGWAQVNFGYGSTDADQLTKLKYDLYYIRHRSLLLDMLILLRTVGQVVRLVGR